MHVPRFEFEVRLQNSSEIVVDKQSLIKKERELLEKQEELVKIRPEEKKHNMKSKLFSMTSFAKTMLDSMPEQTANNDN
jgi:hypothetical protein